MSDCWIVCDISRLLGLGTPNFTWTDTRIMLFWGGEEERCIHKLMMWIIWDSSGGITLMSKLTWSGCFSYDSLHIGPSDNALPWSFKKDLSLAWRGREDRRTYYISICSNLQTLPVWSVTRHTTEGTANIPQHNDVVGEQTFMWSPLVPVIGIGKQNLLQVFQAIFAHRWNTDKTQRKQICWERKPPLLDFCSTFSVPLCRWNHS